MRFCSLSACCCKLSQVRCFPACQVTLTLVLLHDPLNSWFFLLPSVPTGSASLSIRQYLGNISLAERWCYAPVSHEAHLVGLNMLGTIAQTGWQAQGTSPQLWYIPGLFEQPWDVLCVVKFWVEHMGSPLTPWGQLQCSFSLLSSLQRKCSGMAVYMHTPLPARNPTSLNMSKQDLGVR